MVQVIAEAALPVSRRVSVPTPAVAVIAPATLLLSATYVGVPLTGTGVAAPMTRIDCSKYSTLVVAPDVLPMALNFRQRAVPASKVTAPAAGSSVTVVSTRNAPGVASVDVTVHRNMRLSSTCAMRDGSRAMKRKNSALVAAGSVPTVGPV